MTIVALPEVPVAFRLAPVSTPLSIERIRFLVAAIDTPLRPPIG
jgi:hypothetical protein